MSELPKITGVICTHNRERFLERCIQSLYNQTIAEGQYEVLVVDNGSTDKTREICDKFRQRANFKYVYEPVLGLSNARNTGWNNALGDYVGYLDDDAVAADTWFEKALWCFENIQPVPDWVGGPIELEWEVESPDWINDQYRTALGWMDWGDIERFLIEPNERLGGGNSFYLKSILEEMQGFDTRLGRKKNLLLSGEETQFQHRLKSIGGKLFYHPDVRIFHYVEKERTKPSFFYRRYYWGGITDYIMGRTLVGVPSKKTDDSGEKGRLGRLLRNAFSAIGLFSSLGKKVQGRIYMAYVAGWFVATIKFGWRKVDLEKV